MKTRKPLGEKELHKLEKARDPWAEAIAGLQAYKRGVAGRITRTAIQQSAGRSPIDPGGEGYTIWLKARLADTIQKLDCCEMESYPSGEAKALLSARMAKRRRKQSADAK